MRLCSPGKSIKRLLWPVVKTWALMRGQDPHGYQLGFSDTSDTQKITINAKPDDEHALEQGDIEAKTEQTIFREEQPRFRALSSGEREAIKRVLESGHGFKVRIASKPGTPRRASGLVQKRYGGRGYQTPEEWEEPQLFTFLAYHDGELIGTVGVRLDSENRLAADKLYQVELNALREAGHKLCEYTRLAVETTADSKAALATLFHSGYLWAGIIHGHDYCVIEVHPRHIVFYQRMLGFKKLSDTRHNTNVNAPGILLGIEFSEIARNLAKQQKRRRETDTTGGLFDYGFADNEASAILYELEKIEENREKSDAH
ncbi:MAG: hypothetical protein EPO06_08820 [Burkholderiaceae bacterium]|nr:MAG: hypothetical protein EPO06_08820 [Burkholderiaceae bacterium]